MEDNIVFIYKIAKAKYPKDALYPPHIKYPEYPFVEISKQQNLVYAAIRDLFFRLNLDRENFNTPQWNPLKSFISPGYTILLKPNFVFDKVKLRDISYEAINTHTSIIRAVIDYCIIALRGTGKIILGDAPIQSCQFNRLTEINGAKQLMDFYKSGGSNPSLLKGISFELQDFRVEYFRLKELQIEHMNFIYYKQKKKLPGDSTGYHIVDLKANSSFYPFRNQYRKFRVVDYNRKNMVFAHT